MCTFGKGRMVTYFHVLSSRKDTKQIVDFTVDFEQPKRLPELHFLGIRDSRLEGSSTQRHSTTLRHFGTHVNRSATDETNSNRTGRNYDEIGLKI